MDSEYLIRLAQLLLTGSKLNGLMNFNLESNDWSDDTSGNATPLEYCVEDYVSGEVPDLDVDGD